MGSSPVNSAIDPATLERTEQNICALEREMHRVLTADAKASLRAILLSVPIGVCPWTWEVAHQIYIAQQIERGGHSELRDIAERFRKGAAASYGLAVYQGRPLSLTRDDLSFLAGCINRFDLCQRTFGALGLGPDGWQRVPLPIETPTSER